MSGTVPHHGTMAPPPDVSPDVFLEATTRDALAAFARRRRWMLLVRGLTAGALAWLVAAVIVAVIDQLWWLSDPLRWFLATMTYLVAALVGWRMGLGEIAEGNLSHLARRLESAEPMLRGQLLSAVELADPGLTNGSAAFRQRLQRRVAQRIGATPVERLLPVRLIRRWIWAGTIGALACLILLAIPSLEFGRRLARAALPGALIERASLTKIRIVRPDPPSRQVAEGDSVGIVAEISGEPVDEVFLHWRADDGRDGETLMLPRERPASDDATGETSANASSVRAAASGSVATVTVAANVPVESVPIRYRVAAGDGVTLWHTLTPQPRPRVVGFETRYRFPDYAGLPDRVETPDDGDLEAITGTTAEVTMTFDVPVRDVSVRFGTDGAEKALEPIDKDSRRVVATIPITTPGVYRVDATSRDAGIGNPFSPQYSITPLADSPPTVSWSNPPRSAKLVSPLEVVPLEGKVEDEMPLDQVSLEFQINGGPVETRRIPVDTPEPSFPVSLQWDLLEMRADPAERSDSETPDGETTTDEASDEKSSDGTTPDEADTSSTADDQESRSATEPPLRGGDRVLVRLTATDRRGGIGRSQTIELLVADDGFDAARYTTIDRRGEFVSTLLALLDETRNWATGGDVRSLDDASELAESFRDRLGELSWHLAASPIPSDRNLLEMTGLALLDAERSLSQIETRAADSDPDPDSSSDTDPDSTARDDGPDLQTLSGLTELTEGLIRGHFTHEFSKAFLAEIVDLDRSLERLVGGDTRIPLDRFRRYLDVTRGRLETIDRWLQRHEGRVTESARRHHDQWFRFSSIWTQRLQAAAEASPDPNAWRALLEQLGEELQPQSRQTPTDGRSLGELVRDSERLEKRLGWLSDPLRTARDLARELDRLERRRDAESDSKRIAVLRRQADRGRETYRQTVDSVARRIAATESLHRARPVVDLAYAADLKLLARAWENVTSEVSPEDATEAIAGEKALEGAEALAGAIETLQAGHRLSRSLGEWQALIAGERYGERRERLELEHPLLVSRFPVATRPTLAKLRDVGAPPESLEPARAAVDSPELTRARDRIVARRWQTEPIVPLDDPLRSIEQRLRESERLLKPLMAEARETLRRYVASLPEQARQAAERAEAARDRARGEEQPDEDAEQPDENKEQPDEPEKDETDSSDPDSSDSEPEPDDANRDQPAPGVTDLPGAVAEEHERAKRSAEATLDSLTDLANNTDPLDAEQRELARDADAAARSIRDSLDQAERATRDATEAADEAETRDALERSADAHDRLAENLRRTAKHFEMAENGEPLNDSREVLRPDPADDESDPDRQRREAEEELAEQALQSPEERLAELERELTKNRPMRESLDDLSDRDADVALRALERSAREEETIRRSLENSDAAFREQKRSLGGQLRELANRARDVAQNLLEPAERAANWSNDPESRPLFQLARRELVAAAEQVEGLPSSDPPLDELSAAADRLRGAVGRAIETVRKAEENAQALRDQDLHGDPDRRDRAARDMERIARDSRRDRAREANRQADRWGKEVTRAGKQIQEFQRRQRQAEEQLRRATEQLDKTPDDESAARELNRATRQRDAEQRGIEAARNSRQVAEAAEEQARETGRALTRQSVPPLDAPNPAAEVATRLSGEARETLDELRDAVAGWTDDSSIQDDLSVPRDQAERLGRDQRGVTESVAESVEQLRRVARHRDRLGEADAAAELADVAESIEREALSQTVAAQETLSESSLDPTVSHEANRQLRDAADRLRDQAKRLQESLSRLGESPSVPPSSDSDAASRSDPDVPSSESSDESGDDSTGELPDDSADATSSKPSGSDSARGDGRELAQTLDELDRSIYGRRMSRDSASETDSEPADGDSQSGDQQSGADQGDGQPSNESSSESEAGDSQDSGGEQADGTPQTAADASATLESMLDAQRQRAARDRQQQNSPESDSAQQPGDLAASPGTPGDAADGTIDIDDVRRAGEAWGQLRQQRTEQVTEGRRADVVPQYRREIDAYFRAIAKRASEDDAEEP